MEGLTKEDVLSLRLEIAELRREMAELRREIAARGMPGADDIAERGVEENRNASKDEVSTEQIMTEWTEGEDAWKAREKK